MSISRFFPLTLLFSISVLLSACGGNSNGQNGSGTNNNDNSNNKAGSSEFNVLTGEIDTENGNMIGSGQVIFKQSLGSTDVQKSFQMNFKLQEDGSSLVLHTFSSKELTDGLNFEFTRSSGNISVQLNGTTLPDIPSSDGSVSVDIDVHNNESPAHIILKSGDIEYNENGGEWGQGADKFWGLTLNNATVSDAKSTAAKSGH